MCTGAIIKLGVCRIVFGCKSSTMRKVIAIAKGAEPSPYGYIYVRSKMTCAEIVERDDPDIEIIGPLLENEAIKVHEKYWTKIYAKSDAKDDAQDNTKDEKQ
jgi:tRNA(Arg) A34 adenosine deaminase TadA